jgi:hypothetical protein
MGIVRVHQTKDWKHLRNLLEDGFRLQKMIENHDEYHNNDHESNGGVGAKVTP